MCDITQGQSHFLCVYDLYSGKLEDGKHINANQFTINTFSDSSNDDSSITSDSSIDYWFLNLQ